MRFPRLFGYFERARPVNLAPQLLVALDHPSPSRRLPVHVVHFYDPHAFPSEHIAEYLFAGIVAGDSALIIATPEHTRDIFDSLLLRGADPQLLIHDGLLTALDTAAILPALQAHNLLTDTCVDEILLARLAAVRHNSLSGDVRVFAELVDLLAGAGDYALCLQLEAQWNRLLAAHSFALYCAYSTASFAHEHSAETVSAICTAQPEIVPFASKLAPGWLAILLGLSCTLQAQLRRSSGLQQTLRSLERDYAQLFAEHVAHWKESIEIGLRAAPPASRPQNSPACAEVDLLVDRLLEKIVIECQAACAARDSFPPGAPEADKRIGEILAYARMTAALCGLQKKLQPRILH